LVCCRLPRFHFLFLNTSNSRPFTRPAALPLHLITNTV
ncbi:hypothetical protein RB213_014077, partial [Colletotrichum asianum]